MASAANPELQEGFRVLADGAWMAASTLLNLMGAKILPGAAERWARANLTTPDAFGRDELVAMARRRMAQMRVSAMLASGRWEADVEPVTREHWRRGVPFRIRDRFPGSMTVPEAAAEIGVPQRTLTQWIDAGLAPPPDRVSDKPGAIGRVSPATLEIYRQIAAVYPGPHKLSWDPHPHVFWRMPQGIKFCPHCGNGIVTDVSLAKAPERQE